MDDQNKTRIRGILNLLLFFMMISAFVFTGVFIHRCNKLNDKTAADAKDSFYENLAMKNITKIIIYKYWPGSRIEITDPAVINEFLRAARVSHGGGTGSKYAEKYMIKIEADGKHYNFGYARKGYYLSPDCINKSIYYRYRDCGEIFIFEENDSFSTGERFVYGPLYKRAAVLNVDLIPVIIKYVDNEVEKNPVKYSFRIDD